MLLQSLRLQHAVAIALGLLGLEAIGLTVFRNDTAMGWAVSLFFLVMTAGMNFTLCCWRARRAASLRRHWVLLASTCVLTITALVLRGWISLNSLFTDHPVPSQIDFTDLLLVLEYVPTVILLSLPSGRPYLRPFVWIDVFQTVLIAYLAFITLFAAIPFTYTELHPISGDALIAFYNIADVPKSSR
jgi:hypothetical protein